jgi:hypothetical protein
MLAMLFPACLLFTYAHSSAQEVRDVRYYSQEAARAYKEKNYAAYLENMLRAVELRPANPTLLYNLAGAYALNGNRREALDGLARVAEMGLVYGAGADEDFNAIKTQLSAGPAVALIGIDGLYFYRGSLIAIQNGTRPHRVVRISLSADLKRAEGLTILEANNPLFDEPTLGVVVRDDFYYVANSQWGAFDRAGLIASPEKLRETLILKTKL